MKYKELITITGPSGAGKSMLEEYISSSFGYQPIHSMTTREQRDENDVHHRFVSPDFFDKQDPKKLICHDRFDKVNKETGEKTKVEYGCFLSDFGARSVFVVEENGLVELFKRMSREYNVYSIYIDRPKDLRIASVGEDRVIRDEQRLLLPPKIYDLHLYNASLSKQPVYDATHKFLEEQVWLK